MQTADLAFVALSGAFFLLCTLYARACEALR